MPIFDQGYQHWSGKLSGHASRWLAVTRHGVRATIRGRLVKFMLIAAWLPAIVLVIALALWGLLEQRSETVLSFLGNILPAELVTSPQQFRSAVWTVAYSFFFQAELTASIFLVLVVGPSLVSRDLRFNAFPLYFSRPLTRLDYFLGKLGVIGFFLMAIAILPAVVAYLFGLAFSLDLGVIRDTHRLLWGGILYGLVITVSAGTLMLALSSLSRRSIYVGLAWAGFCFLTLMLSGILIGLRFHAESRRSIDEGVAHWLEDHPPPPGIEMRGSFPIVRPPREGTSGDRDAQNRWQAQWSEAYGRLIAEAAEKQQEGMRNDWRPIIGYSTNLHRVGDWLLDTDRAWVTFGKAFEGPRSRFGPAANFHAGGRLPRELTGPPNERFLADRMALQFPVTWSLAMLAGIWIVSALILTTRVKSLDRLK